MKPTWSRTLSRPLTLRDGRKLVTLGDAAQELAARFAGALDNAPLEQAIELLMHAHRSGRRVDVSAATDQVERVLRGINWIARR